MSENVVEKGESRSGSNGRTCGRSGKGKEE